MKRVAMRKPKLFFAVLSLFLLVTASITWAQTISSQKGLTTAEFNLQQGKIKVYLPDDIRPGDVISGRIVTEPLGKNTRQIEKNLGELSKYSISINNERFPVDKEKEMFRFLADPDRKLHEPIELLNVSGIKAAGLIFPETKEQKPASAECMIPSHAMTGSPLRITGQFDGNSSNTNCALDNKPMEILAESPRQCIVSYPADAGGVHTLSVQEINKQPCAQSVSGVKMDVSAGKLNLQKGEKTYIDVSITGLQNLPDTAILTLDNLSIDVVAMQPFNNIIIPLAPDSVGSGTFTKRFAIQSLKTGSFTVNVNLDLPDRADSRIDLYDIRKTGGENKTDTIPCKDLEDSLKKLEESLQGLKDELAGIDGEIQRTQNALKDCKEALAVALAEYHAAKKEFDKQAERKHNYGINKQSLPPGAEKEYDKAKTDKENASKKWSDQNKICKALEQKIAQLESRKSSLPGLIKSLEGDIGKLKTEIEKCKEKEAEKKRKAEEERKKSEAEAAAKTAAEKAEADARRERVETNRYLLQNIYSLGLISSKEFWETPGITSWLPEVLEKPIGDIAEEIGKSTIPADAIPALAGIYQIVGMLLDPCTADGSRKTFERLKKMINTRTEAIYTDEQALDKTEKMCEMLKKIKALSAAAGKK